MSYSNNLKMNDRPFGLNLYTVRNRITCSNKLLLKNSFTGGGPFAYNSTDLLYSISCTILLSILFLRSCSACISFTELMRLQIIILTSSSSGVNAGIDAYALLSSGELLSDA